LSKSKAIQIYLKFIFFKSHFSLENPFAKALQKFSCNYNTSILLTIVHTYLRICQVTKCQNFYLKILFYFFTRQSIMLYDNHGDTNNTQYRVEQIQTRSRCWDSLLKSNFVPRSLLPALSPALYSYFRSFPVGAVFAGKLLVYTSRIKIRDKGRSQFARAKVGTCIPARCNGMHICTPLYTRVPFSFCFPSP